MNNFIIETLGCEVGDTDFGDKRLTARLKRIVDSIARSPGDSLPKAAGGVSELEGTYRFLGNPKVTPEKIISGHIEATVQRACLEDRVVIAHDTTQFLFGGSSRQKEIGAINQGNQGFLGHFALAVSRAVDSKPLGILGFEPIFRKAGAKKETSRGGKPNDKRESLRWWQLADKVQSYFPPDRNPIHVMDREADDYELFSDLCQQNIRFVIRVRQDRRDCSIPEQGDSIQSLYECLDKFEVLAEREVTLSARAKHRRPKENKNHPPRDTRKANLCITAGTITIPKPKHLKNSRLSPELTLNCIHVYEVNQPAEATPVNWKLITSNPISSVQQVLDTVDDYRARWMIEEYFKALKTGCAYEKRQLENRHSLLNALAVFIPVAWQLLLLRTLNRTQSDMPAHHALTRAQIKILQTIPKKPISEKPTIREALLAVAALGGHIPNNGDPGWIVLSRGMEKLLDFEIGWTAASIGRSDQS